MGPASAGENGSQAVPMAGEVRVPNGEYSPMKPMEVAGRNRPMDASPGIPKKPGELPNRDDPVLPSRKFRQRLPRT